MKTRSKSKLVNRFNQPGNNINRMRSCRNMKIKKTRQSTRLRSIGHHSEQSNHGNKPNSTISQINRPTTSPIKRKSPKQTKETKEQTRTDVCNFCFTNTKDDHMLGELKTLDDITAHKFCLYFSPGLSQNGEPDQGLWGFIPDDIRKELRRGVLLKCSYCKEKGAVVGCSVAECLITFHLPCGMQNGAFLHYHQEQRLYPSYCKKHRPKLQVPSFKRQILCTICQEFMKNCDRDNLLYLTCCQSYYHRECLVNVAYHQGEFNLRCPNCNNNEEFVATIKNSGIYVPYRDPTWELTGEARVTDVEFQCVANECLCQQGRRYNGDNEWELFTCDRCGSNATHLSCAGLPASFLEDRSSEWLCDICRNVSIQP